MGESWIRVVRVVRRSNQLVAKEMGAAEGRVNDCSLVFGCGDLSFSRK